MTVDLVGSSAPVRVTAKGELSVYDAAAPPGTAWHPVGYYEGIWGRFQVVVGGVDVTYYRGVPVEVQSCSWSEPFGAATAEIRFPQISPFEPNPYWLHDWANIEIWRVNEANQRADPHAYWEGMVTQFATRAGESFGTSVHAIGPLYQADFYVKPPSFHDDAEDIGHKIAHVLNERSSVGNLRLVGCTPVTTGIRSRSRGSWDRLLTGYVQDLLGIATTGDGEGQWTLDCAPGRRPVIKPKDRTTLHWTVMIGAPGVEVDLNQDLVQAPTTYYGEGTDAGNCHWRNSKYPNLHPDEAPVFPGRLISLGATGADVSTWKRRMGSLGYKVTGGSTYTSTDRAACMRLQRNGGIQVDGVVGPQTWAVTFDVGSNSGSLEGAFFEPLVWSLESEPYLYGPDGANLGPNPQFRKNAVRIEVHQTFGDRISIEEAVESTRKQYARDAVPAWTGTVVLKTDPQEGNRYDMRAGHNVMVRLHRGVNRLLHIAACEIDFDSEEVRLTVDDKGRDLLTVAQAISRDRSVSDPVKRPRDYYRKSHQVEDRIATWDCESGAGTIPYLATYKGLWNVIKIPMAERGTIVRSRFATDTPARYVIGIFDRQVTANQLAAYGSPLDEGYWDAVPTEDLGCVMAWGSHGQAAGFYPGQEAEEGDPVTGVLQDDGSWFYESTAPPWMWVAMWVESPTVNYIEGRLYPGMDALG